MNITLEQFQKTIPSNKEAAKWYSALPAFFKKYEINTRNRVAAFLAQVGHESLDLRAVEENLNYSWQGLVQTFGRRYFPSDAVAQQYHRQPEKIANWVYDDRNPARKNKLGNVRDGDGWKFRGGGAKQLTGRFNYEQFGKDIGMTADEAAAYVRTPEGALESAGWFWKKNNLNRFADADDIVGMTKAINGGTIGLADRQARYARAKAALPAVVDLSNTSTPPVKPVDTVPLTQVVAKVGDRGDLVKRIQTALGFTGKNADGIFGNGTKAAVQSWQRTNRFTATGDVTQEQANKLLGIR